MMNVIPLYRPPLARPFARSVAVAAGDQQLEVAAHRDERSAQVVRDVGDQIASRLLVIRGHDSPVGKFSHVRNT